MRIPVIFFGEGFCDDIVEVLVVGEDDTAADVVELLRISTTFAVERLLNLRNLLG